MDEIRLHGTVMFDPRTNKWEGSGDGWWLNETAGDTARVEFEEPMSFDAFSELDLDDPEVADKLGMCDRDRERQNYSLVISDSSRHGEVETSHVTEAGFDIRWVHYTPSAPLVASFTATGKPACYVPNDRALPDEKSVADIHAAGLLFDYEAKYGVISLMGSASMASKEETSARITALGHEMERIRRRLARAPEAMKPDLQEQWEVRQHRLERLQSIRDHASRYWESAYQFGQLWGQYAAEEQERVLDGRYVPLCTGGGPGIMQAAAEGARAKHAHVIGIDCQFGYDNFFNLKDSYAVHSNQRLRLNNFSIREGILINYSHVILFWPGGYGTAWEVCETLSKISTLHLRRRRTKAIFVHREFWEPFFQFVTQMRRFGAINGYGDRIKIPGVDDQDPDKAYVADVVDTAEEAFAMTKAFVEELHRRNQLTLRS